MAGETTQADGFSTTAFQGRSRQECVLDISHEVTVGELELADVINLGVVPQGAIYTGGFIATDDLDSATSLDLLVGDANDPDGLQATGTVGQAAGITQLSGTYITNKETTATEQTVSITVGAAAGTPVAGTIRVVVRYYVL